MLDYPGNKRRAFTGIMQPTRTIKARIVYGEVVLSSGTGKWFYYSTKPDGMIYKLCEFSSGQTPFGWHHVGLKLGDKLFMHEYGKEFSVWNFAVDRAMAFRYPDVVYIYLGNATAGNISAWFQMSFWREIDRS